MKLLFLISNLTEAILLMLVALILLLVKSRDDSGVRYYQRAKRWMSLCIFVSGLSFLSELAVGGFGDRVEILDIYNQMFFFIVSVSGQLALLHLYNSERLSTRTLVWVFAPVVVLLGVYVVLVMTLGSAPEIFTMGEFLQQLPSSPVLILRVLILGTIVGGISVSLFRYFQARRAYRAMLDDYFSDDQEWQRTKWIDTTLYCAFVLVISTVFSYLGSFGWWDLVFQLIVTACMLFLVVRFINYQGRFPGVAPAVEFAYNRTLPAVFVRGDQLVADSIANRKVTGWMQRPDKPYLMPGLTLNDVAQMMNLSRHRLSAYLNITKNTNFSGWIASLRIQEVAVRLRDQKCTKTLSEIAYECGFSDLAAMSNTFKKATGESPSVYRRRFSA